jgi:hypothetical protein
MKKIALYAMLVLFTTLFSCAGIHIEKRRFNKEFYIDFHAKQITPRAQKTDSGIRDSKH